MLPRAEALTASSLRSRQINSSSNSRAKQRPFQGRPRSLSETSDSTIVPATFAKEAKAAREGRVSSSTNVSVAQANYDSDVSSRLATSTQATSASSTKSQDSASSRSLRRTLSEGPHRQSVEIQTLSPRALQTMLVSLQLLSLVPAIVGASYCIYRAISPPTRTVTYSHGLVKTLRWTQRIEWLLCAMWAGLSGNYCHSMARGLTRRWLVYYPLPAAIIRLVCSYFPDLRRVAANSFDLYRSHCRSSAGHLQSSPWSISSARMNCSYQRGLFVLSQPLSATLYRSGEQRYSAMAPRSRLTIDI